MEGNGAESKYTRLAFRAVAVMYLVISVTVLVPETKGFASLRYENARERVMGTLGFIAARRISSEEQPGNRIILEAGEVRLFEIPDLRVDGLRVTVEGRHAGLWIDGVALSSPIGSEKTVGIAIRIQTDDKVVLAGRLDGSFTDIDPLAQAVLWKATGFVITSIAECLSIGIAVEDVRLSGEPLPGADLSLCAVARPSGMLTVVSSFAMNRWGQLGLEFAASLRFLPFFSGSFGYDDGTGQFSTAVTLTSGSLGCEVGVLYHPVLGVSKGVFLQWRR